MSSDSSRVVSSEVDTTHVLQREAAKQFFKWHMNFILVCIVAAWSARRTPIMAGFGRPKNILLTLFAETYFRGKSDPPSACRAAEAEEFGAKFLM